MWFKDDLVQHNDDNASLPIAPAVLCELVVRRAAAVTEATLDSLSTTTGIVNFKKFKKVIHVVVVPNGCFGINETCTNILFRPDILAWEDSPPSLN